MASILADARCSRSGPDRRLLPADGPPVHAAHGTLAPVDDSPGHGDRADRGRRRHPGHRTHRPGALVAVLTTATANIAAYLTAQRYDYLALTYLAAAHHLQSLADDRATSVITDWPAFDRLDGQVVRTGQRPLRIGPRQRCDRPGPRTPGR
ncbi:hypothetical protein [Nocardia sp. NPDC051981]|uniref:hypothetical protein n=1 Tax=Nocardia sp. NPDC051981 TaxID=3155417 RepID=UPI003419AA7D